MVARSAAARRNGVRDFLLVRMSALVLAAFALFMLLYFLSHPHLSYANWQNLFSALPMKVFTLLALLGVTVHGWIGLWQVITDYIKPVTARAVALMVVTLLVVAYLSAGVLILWGV